jgi:hypothetical protein
MSQLLFEMNDKLASKLGHWVGVVKTAEFGTWMEAFDSMRGAWSCLPSFGPQGKLAQLPAGYGFRAMRALSHKRLWISLHNFKRWQRLLGFMSLQDIDLLKSI